MRTLTMKMSDFPIQLAYKGEGKSDFGYFGAYVPCERSLTPPGQLSWMRKPLMDTEKPRSRDYRTTNFSWTTTG